MNLYFNHSFLQYFAKYYALIAGPTKNWEEPYYTNKVVVIQTETFWTDLGCHKKKKEKKVCTISNEENMSTEAWQ